MTTMKVKREIASLGKQFSEICKIVKFPFDFNSCGIVNMGNVYVSHNEVSLSTRKFTPLTAYARRTFCA